jgi:apolipoprotein D and lipocalin family protein
MQKIISAVSLGLAAADFLGSRQLSENHCPPPDFSTVADFDLESFIAAPWYIQQQQEVSYLPLSRNYCVKAEYSKRGWSFFGYDLSVQNTAQNAEGEVQSSQALCAKIVDPARGKLKVAPCFLPSALAGPYWVMAYEEVPGYALISGGPPTIASNGACRTGSGVNDAGLWIFTRQQTRNETLIDDVRAIASSKGFDLTVLNDVDQANCQD